MFGDFLKPSPEIPQSRLAYIARGSQRVALSILALVGGVACSGGRPSAELDVRTDNNLNLALQPEGCSVFSARFKYDHKPFWSDRDYFEAKADRFCERGMSEAKCPPKWKYREMLEGTLIPGTCDARLVIQTPNTPTPTRR